MKSIPQIGDLIIQTRPDSASVLGRVADRIGDDVISDSGDVVRSVEALADGIWQARTGPDALDLRVVGVGE
jgi:hypothetical protein